MYPYTLVTKGGQFRLIIRWRVLCSRSHQLQMEKYSKHLETLVAERTQELKAEQRRTSKLLYSKERNLIPLHALKPQVCHDWNMCDTKYSTLSYSMSIIIMMSFPNPCADMLPRQIADDLKLGKQVPAKLYQSATVFMRYVSPCLRQSYYVTMYTYICTHICTHS